MNVNKISIAPYTLKREQQNRNASKSVSSQNNTGVDVSSVSFKGYSKQEQQSITGGINRAEIGSDVPAEVRKLTEIYSPYPNTKEGKYSINVYYADIDERVDRSKIPGNTHFIVEYQKPEIPKYSKIEAEFSKKRPRFLEESKAFNNKQIYNDRFLAVTYDRLREAEYFQYLNRQRNERMPLRIGQVYIDTFNEDIADLNKNNEACREMVGLINEALPVLEMPASYHRAVDHMKHYKSYVDRFGKMIAELEAEAANIREKDAADLKSTQEACDKADEEGRPEAMANFQMAKANHKMNMEKLRKINADISDALRSKVDYEKKYNEAKQRKEMLEPYLDPAKVEEFKKESKAKIKKIYAEKLPKDLG